MRYPSKKFEIHPNHQSEVSKSISRSKYAGLLDPFGKRNVRGHSILPLYPSVPEAALKDEKLYELLALVDALRIGRAREKELAVVELKTRMGIGEFGGVLL